MRAQFYHGLKITMGIWSTLDGSKYCQRDLTIFNEWSCNSMLRLYYRLNELPGFHMPRQHTPALISLYSAKEMTFCFSRAILRMNSLWMMWCFGSTAIQYLSSLLEHSRAVS